MKNASSPNSRGPRHRVQYIEVATGIGISACPQHRGSMLGKVSSSRAPRPASTVDVPAPAPHRWVLMPAIVAVAVVCGCGGIQPGSGPGSAVSSAPDHADPGDIPDTQAFVEVTTFPGFTVKVPEGWTTITSGASTTFTDKLNTITVESRTAVPAPTEDTVRREIDQQFATAPGYGAATATTVTRPAGTAIEGRYRIGGSLNPVSGKPVIDDVERYEFFRDGQLVTLTLSAPVGADNVDPWRTVTDSFRWSP